MGESLISTSGTFSIFPSPPPDSLIYLQNWSHFPITYTVSDTFVRFSQQAQLLVYSDSSKSIVGTLVRENYIPDWNQDNPGLLSRQQT